jgi:HK97 family phage portal protein
VLKELALAAATSLAEIRDRSRPPVPFPNTGPDQQYALATFLGQTPVTPVVSETTVRGLPAMGAAVDKISNAVASMLVEAQVFDANDQPVVVPPVVRQPNVLIDEFEFWYQLVGCLMCQGNYVAIPTDFTAAGYPNQVVPVHPSVVNLDQSTGFPIYRISGLGTFGYGELIHIRRAAPVGSLWGMGVVEQYRRALKLQLHEQTYGINSMDTGGVPSTVITLDVNKVEKDVATQVQSDWIDAHGSASRKPAVVPKTMSVTPLSWSPEDAEFIEARQLSIAEAAMMCGLDPSDLSASVGATSSITYANATERNIQRVIEAYSPWMQRIERAWSELTPGRLKVRGNPEALQRTSTKERLEIRKLAQEIGIETPAESRELEHRPPAPEPTTETADPTEEEDPDE